MFARVSRCPPRGDTETCRSAWPSRGHVLSDTWGPTVEAMRKLLRRGPAVKLSQVEEVLGPVLEDWRWKPHLATRALQSLGASGFPRTASQVLEVLRRKNIGPSFVQFNAAIHASGKHSWTMALSIFDSMRVNLEMPDLTSCNSAMSVAKWQVAWQLFGALPTLKLLPDQIAFNSLATALKALRQWRLALSSLQENSHRFAPDVVGISSAISTCAVAKAWRFSLLIFGSAETRNAMTVGGALSACDKGSQWQLGLDIFDDIETRRRNSILCNSLISACRAGGWQWALALLDQMEDGSLQRDLWSFSGAVKACAEARYWEAALGLFSSAHWLRLGVNEVLTSSTVSACAKASQWQLAFLLASKHPSANSFSFSAAISSQKSWLLALHLFHLMPQSSVEVDLACRNALFLSCESAAGAWRHALMSAERSQQKAAESPTPWDHCGKCSCDLAPSQAVSWQAARALQAGSRWGACGQALRIQQIAG